jgi:hypothetical protein
VGLYYVREREIWPLVRERERERESEREPLGGGAVYERERESERAREKLFGEIIWKDALMTCTRHRESLC